MKVLNNENKDACGKCGGRCCKNMSGAYIPADFPKIFEIANNRKAVRDYIRHLLNRGDISLDSYMGEDFQYFLRPRHIDSGPIDESWGGVCMHLTDTGCKLTFEDRPYQCRELKPMDSTGECSSNETKRSISEYWGGFNQILDDIFHEFTNGKDLK